jgi:multidrug transporter EmrE-like cation transporter
MAWLWLTLAGLLEVVWAIGLKYTEGFTRLAPSAITVGGDDRQRSLRRAEALLRLGSILLIIIGIAGLKLLTP